MSSDEAMKRMAAILLKPYDPDHAWPDNETLRELTRIAREWEASQT